MKKWTLLDTAKTPDGGSISLLEHDGSHSIRVDGVELMSTRRHNSEEKLAELACAGLLEKPGARILIGGLGFGFTLRAALPLLSPHATVLLAEILAPVIQWNQNPALGLAADALADPRVTLRHADVQAVIQECAAGRRLDSILLDVDNGAAALTTGANESLYELRGLRSAYAALVSGGCAAYWSATPNKAFEQRLVRAGFQVTVQRCHAHRNSGSRHTLFVARRP